MYNSNYNTFKNRDSFLNVRVTKKDLNRYKEQATECGMCLSDYVRLQLSKTPTNRVEITTYAHKLLNEIQKINGNIEALVKKSNNSFLNVDDRNYLLSAMSDLRDYVDLAVDETRSKV